MTIFKMQPTCGHCGKGSEIWILAEEDPQKVVGIVVECSHCEARVAEKDMAEMLGRIEPSEIQRIE